MRFIADSKPVPPPRAAAALRYEHERDAAPRVVASGRGAIAERIIALAKEHDIPLKEDDALVQLLLHVPVGDTVPTELYTVVAEILAAVYRAEQRAVLRP